MRLKYVIFHEELNYRRSKLNRYYGISFRPTIVKLLLTNSYSLFYFYFCEVRSMTALTPLMILKYHRYRLCLNYSLMMHRRNYNLTVQFNFHRKEMYL